MRSLLLTVHRWVGLMIALAVILTGLTGAVIPYQDQIRSLLAPDIWNVVPPEANSEPKSGVELARLVEADSGGIASFIDLTPAHDHAHPVFVSSAPGGAPLAYQQAFVDPYTGEIRARVRFADLRDGPINIAPFLVEIHYSLAAGPTGRLVLGVAALSWAVVSVAGLILTWPRGRRVSRSATLRQWANAWRIRRRSGSRVFLYDLHRAVGLWLLPLMLAFAWSAVAFNLNSVHSPVQRLLGAQGLFQPVVNTKPASGPPMSAERAVEVGAALMAREAQQRDFIVRAPEALSLRPYANLIGYYALTSLDGPVEQGSTAVWFDQASGELVKFEHPYGATKADAFDKTLRLLHTADFFGWPFKILISLFGILAAVMAGAGVAVWLRKTGRRRA